MARAFARKKRAEAGGHNPLVYAIRKHWKLLALLTVCGALAGGALGKYAGADSARAVLLPSADAQSRFLHLSALTLLQSPELLREVATRSASSSAVESLVQQTRAEPIEPGAIQLTVEGYGRARNRELADLYAATAIEKLTDLKRADSESAYQDLNVRLIAVQNELQGANEKLASFQTRTGTYDLDAEAAALVKQGADLELKRQETALKLAGVERQIQSVQAALADHHPALLVARQAVDRAALRYTDEHPKMQELRANVDAIRARLLLATNQVDPEVALSSSSLAKDLYAQFISLRTEHAHLGTQLEQIGSLRERVTQNLSALPEKRLEYARLSTAYESLKRTYEHLVQQRQAAELSARNASGPYRLQAAAHTVVVPFRPFSPLAGALMGLAVGGALAALRELCRRRIQSEADLERATRLPILASLGDLNRMTAHEQEQWAFNAFAHLKGTLMNPRTQNLMCGFISSRHGEGRSTCISLLAEAAAKQGYRTRVVTTNRTQEAGSDLGLLPAPADLPMAVATCSEAPLAIPLPGWVWNKELREQWQLALTELKSVDNLVTFIELPPACESEGILLAEKFSPLIWIGARNHSNMRETRSHMEMLQCSGGRLAAALFNHAGPAKRWIAAALVGAVLTVQAQNPPAPAVQEQPTISLTNAFSVVSPTHLAEWQHRLTLGPGDILNIMLFDQPETLRNNIMVSPDGTINYLQARDLKVTGLTVEELREQIENTLLKFLKPPLRVVIYPQMYNSKKYYLLGNVMNKGVFALERPLTVLEAVARGRGFVRNAQQQSMSSLAAADLSRSFLVRKQPSGQYQRVPVDFEALFLRADLTQNVPLAPDDYLYFPELNFQEVYVLGEVLRPGPVQLVPDLSVTRGIALRGGFTLRAYRGKVLVVRGSLKAPQTFIINVSDVLAAKSADLRLEPRDIVYVSRKPWYRVEELLEGAILAFVGSAAITAAGENVGPFITDPLF